MTKSMWWEVAASLSLLLIPLSLFFSFSAHRRKAASQAAAWLGASLLALTLYVFLVIRAAKTSLPPP